MPAETIGTGEAAAARRSRSSLKTASVSAAPPPRAMIMRAQRVAAPAPRRPATGAGLNGLHSSRMDAFSAVAALAGQAAQNGTVTAWGVALSADFFTQMRDSDPDAALREAALPPLLTYSGNERILRDATQAQTIAAVQSLPAGRVVLEPFTAGDHNYLAKDPATAAALDEALRKVTPEFLADQRG